VNDDLRNVEALRGNLPLLFSILLGSMHVRSEAVHNRHNQSHGEAPTVREVCIISAKQVLTRLRPHCFAVSRLKAEEKADHGLF